MPDANAAVYARFGRRLAAYLLDLAITSCVLILIALTIRFFRSVGLWQLSDPGVPPEQKWMALGVIPKLAVMLHEKFDHLHIKGEWFRAEPELLEFIEKWTQWSRYPCRCGNCWTTPEEIQYFLTSP